MQINLNDRVRVRLTDEGRRIYRDWWLALSAANCISKYFPPVEVDGVSQFQLWELMNIFGSHVYMGNSNLPFAPEFNIMDGDWI